MKFNNRENTAHKIDGRIIWESRSPAVNIVVIMTPTLNPEPYVLVAKRGPKAADYHGFFNLIAGYLDWDENATQAIYRETWEEVGLYLDDLIFDSGNKVLQNDLNQPWFVQTNPDENHQNVSLRYGIKLLTTNPKFPDLSVEHNEVEGEVEDPQWMPISKIDKYEWAFNHDKVIKDYLAYNLTWKL